MKAVLFVHTPEGDTSGQPFEGTGCVRRARALRESIREDYPEGTIFSIGNDDEAADDYTAWFLAELRD